MASFPLLFGAPSFGSEDRDQWIRVLTLFLQDPFKPQASIVNGAMQVNYQYSIPGEAITGTVPGSAIWRNNAHGIRELNEFSDSEYIADNTTRNMSDRPCILFAYNATDNTGAIYICCGTTFANSGAFLVYATDAPKWTTNAPLAGAISCYHDGSSAFIFDNQMGHTVTIFGCVISLGDQITS